MTGTVSHTRVQNRLTELMDSGRGELVNIYFTAGYPNLSDTTIIMDSLQSAGVDMIEVGMPFSDPLADGPTIQQSNMRALANGMNLELLFRQLEQCRIEVPVIMMGYLNPVLQYGIADFCKRASEIGIAGLILPDLPAELYEMKYQSIFEEHNLSNICLVTPQTSPARVRKIDRLTSGFIYAVSSASTTGNQDGSASADYIRGLSDLELRNPIMTGFNIKDRQSFLEATKYSRGGIIGSAFIRAISDTKDLGGSIHSFVQKIRS